MSFHVLQMEGDKALKKVETRIFTEASLSMNPLDTLRNFIPMATTKITEAMSVYRNQDELSIEVKKATDATKGLMKRLQSYRFVDYTKTMVVVPQDFTGDLESYLAFLDTSMGLVQKATDETLQEFSVVLSTFTNSAAGKVSMADHTAFFDKTTKFREDYQARLKSYFAEKANGVDRRPLGKVIGRFADVEVIMRIAAGLEKTRLTTTMDKTQAQVKRCVDQLHMLVRQAEKLDKKDVGFQMLQNVVHGAREVALLVELAAVYRYHAMSAVGVSAALVKQLDHAIK